MKRTYQYFVLTPLILGVLYFFPITSNAAAAPRLGLENASTTLTPSPALNTPDARAAVVAEITTRVQARITNLAANVSTRLENTLSRFELIITRLEVRIGIMQQAGIDTSVAELELEKARAAVATTRTTLATIDADVAAATASTNLRAGWLKVRTTYETAQIGILTAHSALTATVAALRNSTSVLPASTSPITTPTN